MTLPLWPLLVLPWVAVVLRAALRVKLPAELPPATAAGSPVRGRLVSVVIPARNEEDNIRRVVESVARSRWPRFEIVVVDDRSTDGTGDVARTLDAGRAERIEVLDGEPLPEGWLGKPWACRQGAARARGDLILFTDADTVHQPDLLGRAVAALDAEEADAVSVVGAQLMETFWERVVQPQVFVAMTARFPDQSRPLPPERWRDAIANGQYILFRAAAYRELGGHEAVKGEVAEDLRLAQILVKEGFRYRLLRAEEDFATRMYRSLPELVAGWSKNVVPGGLQTLPPSLRRAMAPVTLLVLGALWLAPPAALLAALAGGGPPALLPWSATVVALSAAYWCAATARFRQPWWYGLFYPLGAAVFFWIVLKSWRGMRSVTWKGRTYRTAPPTE